ncbi:MAG TPA: Xaa-Pro peptidase family protein [Acidimicrobiia bacterium]|nr:Xaa-Pro peptidase family protein [Acidimicrobiia bacterium]
MFPDFDYAARLDRARMLMTERGIDVLMLSVGADLPYFSGYEAMPLERLTMLVVPRDGSATMVVPRLEAPRVEPRGDAFVVRAWDETEDPIEIAANLVGTRSTAALGDPTWSVFLLGLQQRLAHTSFVSATGLTRELRMRKEPEEVRWLRAAAEATDRVVARLDGQRFSGRTERELSRLVADMTLEEGHDLAAFGIVASGPNAASPHHEAGDRVIGVGETIVVDFGGRLRGYCSDTTRTFHTGTPSGPVADAFSVLEAAQAAARAAVAPGVSAEAVDRAARRMITDAGYGDRFIHRTGHGIGLEVHEHPYVVEGNRLPLEPGMAFSIEPGIYEPGSFGMRIEDIVVCGDAGVDELNRSPRRLHLVD